MKLTIPYAFFGTGPLAESVLASLYRAGYIPELVVTKPDSPQGRHMELTPPMIKVWAELKGIKVLQPAALSDETFFNELRSEECELFIVASYGKIIPNSILNLPKHGALNVHPSLLPKYRGPSPIETALLNGDLTTGVTIMKLDEKMDHGPILVQAAFPINLETTSGKLEVECGMLGGDLLTQVLDPYIEGILTPKEQNHDEAILCHKITKDMGEITLDTKADVVCCKFRALTPWPSIYFFHEKDGKKIRVKVTKVDLVNYQTEESSAKDVILSVIPEGKKEISFDDFKRSYI